MRHAGRNLANCHFLHRPGHVKQAIRTLFDDQVAAWHVNGDFIVEQSFFDAGSCHRGSTSAAGSCHAATAFPDVDPGFVACHYLDEFYVDAARVVGMRFQPGSGHLHLIL